MRPLFREMHAEGKKAVTKESLVKILPRLIEDECIIGKIPNVLPHQFEGLFAEWQTGDDGLITWHQFAEGCNQWPWHMVDSTTMQERIDAFFARAQKLKMQGKEQESREMASKALRLQGSLSRTKPIEIEIPKPEPPNRRGDTFFRTVLRREGHVAQDDALDNTRTLDQT